MGHPQKHKVHPKVGARIRQFRKAKGYGLNEFARLSLQSQGHLSEIERGKKDFTVTKLLLIAKALGVPPSELLDP